MVYGHDILKFFVDELRNQIGPDIWLELSASNRWFKLDIKIFYAPVICIHGPPHTGIVVE